MHHSASGKICNRHDRPPNRTSSATQSSMEPLPAELVEATSELSIRHGKSNTHALRMPLSALKTAESLESLPEMKRKPMEAMPTEDRLKQMERLVAQQKQKAIAFSQDLQLSLSQPLGQPQVATTAQTAARARNVAEARARNLEAGRGVARAATGNGANTPSGSHSEGVSRSWPSWASTQFDGFSRWLSG